MWSITINHNPGLVWLAAVSLEQKQTRDDGEMVDDGWH